WDKTKEYSNTSGDALLDITKEGWELTKEYSNIGKNIVIEQTLLNGINVLTDNSKVKVVLLDINDTTNYIDMVFYLKGEDKNLTVKIKDFTWGVSKDDKHIVFETLDINLDIEWINYLLVDAIKRDGGRLVLPNKATTFSLLFSIKPNIKIKKALPTKDKFDFVHYEYDKSFFNINKFEVINGNIVVDIFTKGGKNISCNIKSYILRTANRKSIIALQDLKFGVCNKPWIQSIIEKQNREIHFDFTDKLYQLFNEKVE
ncbi:MAG: hypothetical protein KAJ49_08615, partial [Arcobacteraceae bacterium]|nr:hypothetical protein [Arcobacteraceae bacterium]